MSNITALTVPGVLHFGANLPKPDIEKIVGLVSVDGHELWVPPEQETRSYEAYDPGTVKEVVLPFQDEAAAKLMNFFGSKILPSLRLPLGAAWNSDTYNCHSFAAYLNGKIDGSEIGTSDAEKIALDIVEQGRRVTIQDLKLGDHVVIGVVDDEVIADHTFIALDEELGIQVTGAQGSLAIARHDAMLDGFTRTSNRLHNLSDTALHSLHLAE